MIKPYRYGEIDGVRNFSNQQIMGIWDKIVEEGKKDYISRITKGRTREDFLRSIRSGKFDFWIFIEDKKLFAVVWVKVKGKRAELDWCTFSGFRQIIQYGKDACDFIMKFYSLDVIYGFTPRENKLALKYMRKLGFLEGGILPQGSYSYKEDKSDDSILMYQLR